MFQKQILPPDYRYYLERNLMLSLEEHMPFDERAEFRDLVGDPCSVRALDPLPVALDRSEIDQPIEDMNEALRTDTE